MCANVLVTKTGGKRLFGRRRRRWKDNITIQLKNRVWGCGL